MAKAHENVLVYKIDKIPTGVVGQCVAIPTIIVQAKSTHQLKKEMDTAVVGYFQACPEAKKTIVSALGIEKGLGKMNGFGELKVDLS